MNRLMSVSIMSIIAVSIVGSNYEDISRAKGETNLNEVNETVANVGLIVKPTDINIDGQLFDIYRMIGNSLELPYTYIKILHRIAGDKAIYTSLKPDIRNDLTAECLKGAFEIDGVVQIYDKVAWFINCENTNIVRPSKYYFPDAGYNVAYTIKEIMKNREIVNRGELENEFSRLTPEAKRNVLFYEALMMYLGYPIEQVNNIQKAYVNILESENKLEYAAYIENSDIYDIRNGTIELLNSYGIDRVEPLVIAFSTDSLLVADSGVGIISKIELPNSITYGVKSRANMLMNALSAVGKVRYVWGGGHSGANNIEGINPIWEVFNEAYGDRKDCIKSSSGWCPVHSNSIVGTEILESENSNIQGIVDYDTESKLETEFIGGNIEETIETSEPTLEPKISTEEPKETEEIGTDEPINLEPLPTEIMDTEEPERVEFIGTCVPTTEVLADENLSTGESLSAEEPTIEVPKTSEIPVIDLVETVEPNEPKKPEVPLIDLDEQESKKESNTACYDSNKVSTYEEYIAIREKWFSGLSGFNKLKGVSGKIVKGGGYYGLHQLEGLDCSGFIGWVCNQVDKTHRYDGRACEFIDLNRIDTVNYGDYLYPCDIVSWDTHIMMIVGAYDDGKVYLEVESTPNVIRTGVAYYEGADESEIEKAKNLARKVNVGIGKCTENVPIKRLENLKGRDLKIGRFSGFIDAGKEVNDSGLAIENMKVDEIINLLYPLLDKWT